ncbi:hypothetical protein PaecuDRAFT_2924 [Paenibacillus curdlanolyticus YK9]|uniref:Uncharacterized protein n=1 Tax=Paenibacillus curdlanolyticus YK9 TaxID=717606 RepID=E0IAT4_9BACL|nr:hypothetical protein [Paenibacillus curdlanolyticus]EFM10488.1 hypothetical protein PaecuDRAFT_2924 [Paenibacillus curdlanolyticus YK9]
MNRIRFNWKRSFITLTLMAMIAAIAGVAPTAEAAVARYSFKAKDTTGKEHVVAFASDKESKEIVTEPSAFGNEGDAIYSGSYYLVADGKKQKTAVNSGKPMDVNPSQNLIYKVASAAKGTPDVIVIGQRDSSNYYTFEAYAVTASSAIKKLGFVEKGKAKAFYALSTSYKMKNFTSIYFQTVAYNNADAAGWYFTTYKWDANAYLLKETETQFYGYDSPYGGATKKGDYDTGSSLIKRYVNEPKFAVSSSMPKAPVVKAYQFVLDGNTKANLAAGKIPGFNLTMGMSKAQVQKLLGKQTDSYYSAGADFTIFEKASSSGFSFSAAIATEGPLFAAEIGGAQLPANLTWATLEKYLGKPISQGESEVDFDEYYYYYRFGKIDVYIDGKSKTSKPYLITLVQK